MSSVCDRKSSPIILFHWSIWSVPGKRTPPLIISPIIQPKENQFHVTSSTLNIGISTYPLTKCRHFLYIPFLKLLRVLDSSALQHMVSSWMLCLRFVPSQSPKFSTYNLTSPQCLMALSPLIKEEDKWVYKEIKWRKIYLLLLQRKKKNRKKKIWELKADDEHRGFLLFSVFHF